jgi:acetyl esterase/lipase
MKKDIKLFKLFFLFLSINNYCYSQKQIILIWNTTIPGEIKNSNYTEKEVYKESILQKKYNVTNPTLTIYKPEKPNGTSILIFPGGGYQHLSMEKEGSKIAEWLNSMQITAFVVKYRLPSDLIMEDKTIGPLQDAQEAIKIVRKNAKQWKLDENKIGVIGFSAGGHLASTLATKFDEKTYASKDNTISSRPDFTLLIYPVISMKNEITHSSSKTSLLGNNPTELLVEKFSNENHVTIQTPPTFIVHTSDDKSVSVMNSINYYLALKEKKIDAELHLYEKGGHGFGLGSKETSQFWVIDCTNWLKKHNFL